MLHNHDVVALLAFDGIPRLFISNLVLRLFVEPRYLFKLSELISNEDFIIGHILVINHHL